MVKEEVASVCVKEWVHNGVVLLDGTYCDFSETLVLSPSCMNNRVIASLTLNFN